MFRLNITLSQGTHLQGLLSADKILAQSIAAALNALGKLLQPAVRGKVKVFTGREQRGVKTMVTGRGLQRTLWVYGELVQHFIDELGLPPGTFPPWGQGSDVYRYAQRKIKHAAPTGPQQQRVTSHVKTRKPSQTRGAARAVAKSKSSRGAGPRGRSPRGRVRIGPAATRTGGRLHPATRARLARERGVKQFAFLISRAIFERGIRAGEPFKRTLDQHRANIMATMQQAITDAVTKINRI